MFAEEQLTVNTRPQPVLYTGQERAWEYRQQAASQAMRDLPLQPDAGLAGDRKGSS